MALYLLHWSPPLIGGRQPMHYLGWTSRPVEERVDDHLNDRGSHPARIVVAAVAAGREVQLARVWPEGDRALEAKMKAQKHSFKRICPICLSTEGV